MATGFQIAEMLRPLRTRKPLFLSPLGNCRGNVAVTVALSLTVILGMMALTLDTGYMIGEKNRFQNAAEAAAMAGGVALCGDGAEAARQVLLENLGQDDADGQLPENYDLVVTVGYYDEAGEYDFSDDSRFGYRNFIEKEHMPEGVYENAVLVRLVVEEQSLTPGLITDETVRLKAAAVSYLRSFGMLSLGTEAGDGIEVGESGAFDANEPVFRNGDIHANGDIVFENNAPDIDGDTVSVTAHGTVTGYGGGLSNADMLKLPPADAYLEKLYQKADRILDEGNFPSTSSTSWPVATDGNIYRCVGTEHDFAPHPGDHGGIIYYFNFSNPSSYLALVNRFEEDDRITNLTIATNTSIKVGNRHATTHYWGGDGHTVVIVAKRDIDFGSNPMRYTANSCNFDGVTLIAGGDIFFRASSWWTGTMEGTRRLRMIADGKISIPGKHSTHPMAFDFSFGPPCPPTIVKLGRPLKAEQ